MRRTYAVALILAAAVLLCAHRVDAGNQKMNAVVNQMKKLVYQPIDKWQMTSTLTEAEVLDPATPAKKFKKVGSGYFWADTPSIWIRATYQVPEKVLDVPVAGTKISFAANVEDYGEIYVNGKQVQTFHRADGFATITENANPGDKFLIALKISRNGSQAGLLRDMSIQYAALRELDETVTGFAQAMQSLDFILGIMNENPKKWDSLLDKASAKIDVAALSGGDLKKFYASLDSCNNSLLPLSKSIKKYSMMLVGYSHIDPAWLWTKAEGENIVVKGTDEQILGLMKDFPDMVYVANQMHTYRWMEKDYPEIFAQIKQKIKEHKWEPAGAEWVEPDGNLPNGESYVRQFMYGRKYSKAKFNFISSVGLTPDSFGYNWNLPQILKKTEFRGFVTQKISWNDTTKFPYHLFWWQAPDGSKVLVYFPEGGYGESVDPVVMAQQLAAMKSQHGVNSNLVLFGVGDHGGGIPRDYVKRAYSLRSNPLYPKIEFMGLEKVFDRTFADAKTHKFPTWKSELYLQYHRGTYTSQADTKLHNRRNEHCLMNAEKFSTIAERTARVPYAFDQIEEAWKILLFNQFHDILPGSSITPVYQDADKDHAWIAKQCDNVLDTTMAGIAKTADTKGEGQALVLFNGVAWQRDDVISVDLGAGVTEASVYNERGKEVPVQVSTDSDGNGKALFVARNLPPMGYAVYRLVEGRKSTAAARPLKVDGNQLDNEFFTVKIDPATGWVTSVYDKKNKREIVAQGKAAFELQAQQEGSNADAWDPRFPPDGGHLVMPPASEVSIVESGPVRVTIVAKRKFLTKTSFSQYYSLVEGMPIVYGRLNTDYKDPNVFLKSAFAMNMDADYVTYEIPYANIKRTTKPKTAEEKAQWEVSGHRWVDYTDKSGKYGVTLLSYSKYGYDAKENVLRMTMLRSPVGPDPMADKHFHSIPYALYPHAGGWQRANSPRRGVEYNDPVIVVKADSHSGKLGKSRSFFSLLTDNAAISTVKKAENGKGYIVRVVETQGKDGSVTITLPSHPKAVYETNLVERNLRKFATPQGTKLTVPLGHYEIKSIRVVF